MKEVKAFKDSKGKLFESKREYVLSEAGIQRESIKENWKRISSIISSKPEAYYSFIKGIGDMVIDQKFTKSDLEEQLNRVTEIFREEERIKADDYNSSGDLVDHEPFLWGNDILDGYDVNR